MRSLFLLALLFPVSFSAGPLNAQDRFDSGPYKGFRMAHPESTIVELEQPFRVRAVRGVVRDPSGSPLPDTAFEIRDDSSGKVWGAVTDKHGHFTISAVSHGTFSFKATRDGFQSVIGKITVSARASRKSRIRLILPLGI
jgi:carboxypeptidase family protein